MKILLILIILLAGCVSQPSQDDKDLSNAMLESVAYSLESGETIKLETVNKFLESDRLRKKMAEIWKEFEGLEFKERIIQVHAKAKEVINE